jgi:hypothetical protein
MGRATLNPEYDVARLPSGTGLKSIYYAYHTFDSFCERLWYCGYERSPVHLSHVIEEVEIMENGV